MKKMINDLFLKQTLNFEKVYLIFIVSHHFQLKERKLEKRKKFVCNIHNNENYAAHIRVLKQALNQNTKKYTKYIQFNQKAWLKLYIDMNIKLRTEAKNDFEKDF